MLTLLGTLSDQISVLNVFRYITFRTGGAVVTGLLWVFLFGPGMIDALRVRQGKGQPIRSDGPKSHLLTKQGTPTMGGLMILTGLVVSTLLWADLRNSYVWIVLGVTLGFGLIGFYDDFVKVTRASHRGFGGKARLLLEAAVGIWAVYLISTIGRPPLSTSLTFPFFKEFMLNLGWFFIVIGAFVIVGAGNAVNLTDGLDGLAIVPVMIAAATVGGLFVVEALSVIVQVASFKLTGKRVFRMAPIHHHFEQLGWSEPQVVVRFWIISVVLALAGLATLKLR